MTTLERHRLSLAYRLNEKIGKKVKAVSGFSFRCGDTAEIIGWGFRSDDLPVYFIRFGNDECDSIFADFDSNGYIIIE